jgi:uncharacterized protein YeaO (DUF488 family)
MIKLKRAYETVSKSDGYRILVDRLWPRGMSKEKEHLNLWIKDIAPSNELRKAFGHEAEKWSFFKKEYLKELKQHKDGIAQLRELEKKHKVITFVYGAKDEEHNNAVALKSFLDYHKI